MFVPSYLVSSRHGIFYFRWPLPVPLHPHRKPSTLKISLRTRHPKEALRSSLILSNVGQLLTSYGVACGMKYEEVRRLLSTHFNQLLAQKKLQIAEGGRLSELDASILKNSLGLAQLAAAESEPLLPGGNDDETINRFVAKYDLSVRPGTAAYTHLGTEMKRAYRDYCAAVLDYDRSLDSYDFSSEGSAPSVAQTNAANASQVSIRQLSDLYTNESNVGGQWVSKTRHEKADHISLLTEILGEHTDITAVSTTDARKVKDILLGRFVRRTAEGEASESSLKAEIAALSTRIRNDDEFGMHVRNLMLKNSVEELFADAHGESIHTYADKMLAHQEALTR